MNDEPDHKVCGARLSRRFERARIEAQLFAEVCDILLSPRRHRHDTPSVEWPEAAPESDRLLAAGMGPMNNQ